MAYTFTFGHSKLLAALVFCAACLSATATHTAGPIEIDEAQLKAAYIHNFIKFVRWPEAKTPEPRQICVCISGDLGLFRAMNNLNASLASTSRYQVRLINFPGNVDHCDTLFLTDLEADKQQRQLAALDNIPALTISDQPGFLQAGGMIELARNDKRIYFDVNLIAAREAGLSIETRLLKLAGRVLRYADKNEGRGIQQP